MSFIFPCARRLHWRRISTLLCLLTVALFSFPAFADTPRDILMRAALEARTKSVAMSGVTSGLAAAEKILAARPRDGEAMLQKGIALGYRAKLNRSPSDAKAARAIFEQLAAADRNNGEVQMAIACWNLDSIDQLGGFMARTMLGAKSQVGQTALDRAVKLGAGNPFLLGMAAMITIRDDERAIAKARGLAEQAMGATARNDLDRAVQLGMGPILQQLRAGHGAKAAVLARKRLPFGMMG